MGRRSRRIYIYWGVALTLLLALGLFCWVFVLPAMEVANEARRITLNTPPRKDHDPAGGLGGPHRTLRGVRLYLMLPDRLAPYKPGAAYLLGECGKPAVPLLTKALGDSDSVMRFAAGAALAVMGPEAKGTEPALRDLLKRKDIYRERVPALAALWRVSGDTENTFPGLLAALDSGDWRVSTVAHNFLMRYRANSFPVMARMLKSGAWIPSTSNLSSVLVLKKMTEDSRLDVRQAAAEALWQIRAAKKEE